MLSYIHQNKPVRIPVPGNKTILEHFGMLATSTEEFSVARMFAPPGWEEPFQAPDFDEITLMVHGTLRIETGDGTVELAAGESFYCPKGLKVRYSNPSSLESEYWAVCIPAFSPSATNRDEK